MYGDKKVAVLRKDRGLWQPYTWKDYYEKVKYFCLGLLSLGLERGDKGAIIGENDPEGYWAELAMQAAGGTALGIYTDSMPHEVKHFVEHSESKFIIAQDQEQVDKVLSIREELPYLKAVVYWEPKGMWFYKDPLLNSFDQVLEMGKEYEKAHPGLFEQMVGEGKGDDVAAICYTSGTTGLPKGAMFTHETMVLTARYFLLVEPVFDNDDGLSFAPLAWAAEQLGGVGISLSSGLRANFPEKAETVLSDLREVAPNAVMFAGRQWDALMSMIQAKITDSTVVKRFIYRLFLPVGYKVADLTMSGKKPTVFWELLWRLGNWAVFRPLKDQLGFINCRYAIQGGASLGPDVIRFFNAIGLNLKQIYGLSESGGWTTMHRDGDIRFETVGTPFPDDEVRILDDLQITIRSPRLFSGYYKDPEATQKVIRDGWLYTGDAGHIDESGHLIYLDRVADLMELADGSKYAPTYIENRLRFSPYIREAMVIGGEDKAYITAIIVIDFDIVGRWAEKHGIPYTTFADLSQKDEVYSLTKPHVEAVNRSLPEPSRVRRYVHLYKEFDPDEAELTRTRKLRRAFVTERYAFLINAMYCGAEAVMAEAEIRYRDGRTSVMKTPVKIAFVGE
jgi:long-chain acyl-CoA synthetase